jgi:hypothetical protein
VSLSLWLLLLLLLLLLLRDAARWVGAEAAALLHVVEVHSPSRQTLTCLGDEQVHCSMPAAAAVAAVAA